MTPKACHPVAPPAAAKVDARAWVQQDRAASLQESLDEVSGTQTYCQQQVLVQRPNLVQQVDKNVVAALLDCCREAGRLIFQRQSSHNV
jgi:hypothetical protein